MNIRTIAKLVISRLKFFFFDVRTSIKGLFIGKLPSSIFNNLFPYCRNFWRKVGKDLFNLYLKFIKSGGFTTRGFFYLFVIAILFGVAVKIAIRDSWTIGFSDSTLAPTRKLIDLNIVQKRVLENGGSLTIPESRLQGPTCSE